jgi:hypothetical protein
MTTEEKLDRLTGVVNTLAGSVDLPPRLPPDEVEKTRF